MGETIQKTTRKQGKLLENGKNKKAEVREEGDPEP